MSVFQIPLSGVAENFSISMGGVNYYLTVIWRDVAPPLNGGWVLDIADSQQNPIISGVPLVTGADLLEQFGYLGLGGALYVQTAQGADAVPTFGNLGTDAQLFFVTPD